MWHHNFLQKHFLAIIECHNSGTKRGIVSWHSVRYWISDTNIEAPPWNWWLYKFLQSLQYKYYMNLDTHGNCSFTGWWSTQLQGGISIFPTLSHSNDWESVSKYLTGTVYVDPNGEINAKTTLIRRSNFPVKLSKQARMEAPWSISFQCFVQLCEFRCPQ